MESNDLSQTLKEIESQLILSNAFRKDELIRQTAMQIIKDFGEFGMNVKFSGNPKNAYNELLDQLIPYIDNLLKSDYHLFFNFLYRIDLNESLIFKTEAMYPDLDKSEIISHLILQRDLKKVLIRNYYKDKGRM